MLTILVWEYEDLTMHRRWKINPVITFKHFMMWVDCFRFRFHLCFQKTWSVTLDIEMLNEL